MVKETFFLLIAFPRHFRPVLPALMPLQYTTHGKDRTISSILRRDTDGTTLRSYDTASADVDRHMSTVTDQISGLGVTVADTLSAAAQGIRTVRQADAKMSKHTHDKAGTVTAVCQTRPAPHIRVSHKLHGKIHDLLTADIRPVVRIGSTII